MGDGAEAAYKAPPIPNALLKSIHPVGLDLEAVRKHAQQNDSWFQKLQEKEQKLLALPKVTKIHRQAAWERVLKAHWEYIMMESHEAEVTAGLKQVRAQMDARVLELKHQIKFSKIEELKKRLGNRYRFTSLRSHGGKPDLGLPKRITDGLSVLQKVTSTLPQPPSESQPASSETKSPVIPPSEPST